MRRLYDIDNDILNCIDAETGEIDEERLNALEQERDRKVEAVALWCRELIADIVAYKTEEVRFQGKRKSAEATLQSLKNWLSYATDGEKFHSDKVDVTYRKSKSLEIEDETFIPFDYYKTKIKKEVDKERLKKDILSEAIKAPEGVSIVEKLNAQVK